MQLLMKGGGGPFIWGRLEILAGESMVGRSESVATYKTCGNGERLGAVGFEAKMLVAYVLDGTRRHYQMGSYIARKRTVASAMLLATAIDHSARN